MPIERLEASTQYQDAKGTVAIDWAADVGMRSFAEAQGIDTNRYFPLGVNLYRETGEHVSIYCANISVVGDSVDSIREYARSHNGVIPVEAIGVKASMSDFLKQTGRLSIVIVNKALQDFQFDVEE